MISKLADTFTLTVILKMLWFSFIALFPCWFGVIGGVCLMIKEKIERM